jgi:hypothetical protein
LRLEPPIGFGRSPKRGCSLKLKNYDFLGVFGDWFSHEGMGTILLESGASAMTEREIFEHALQIADPQERAAYERLARWVINQPYQRLAARAIGHRPDAEIGPVHVRVLVMRPLGAGMRHRPGANARRRRKARLSAADRSIPDGWQDDHPCDSLR